MVEEEHPSAEALPTLLARPATTAGSAPAGDKGARVLIWARQALDSIRSRQLPIQRREVARYLPDRCV